MAVPAGPGVHDQGPRDQETNLISNIGAPEEIRTPDPQIRSLVLYPAELRARAWLATETVRQRNGQTCRQR
jgi:hypothetical protein